MSRFANAPWPLKATYLTILAIAAGGLLSAVVAIVALAGLRRLSAHIDPAAVPGWFWYYRADPGVDHWLGVGLFAALGLTGVAAVGMARAFRPPLHGAARWAGEAELTREDLRAEQGIVLGRKGGRLLIFGGPEHVMLYAPTRSGKGVGVVIPNLLTWPDSAVVLDVKRENWKASAGFRAAHGQQVILFDPLDAEGRTARFNPLGHIDRTDSIAVLDELQKLSGMLFTAPDNADPFWAEAARTGFIGVGAYIAETPELPFSLGSIYRELTTGDPRVRLPAIVAARADAGHPLPPGCTGALSDFCSASENTFASIKQTITSRMGLWLNPRVRAATDTSDFDLRDFRSKRISLYLGVTVDNVFRVAPLYNLLLQLLVDLNTREPPSAGRHPIQVLVLLDEFARLGHAAVIARGFSYVAGYGLRLLAVLQSPAQLRAQYGHDLAEEIITNCGVEIAFTPKELKIAQDLSERLGYWTYAGRSTNRPSVFSKGHRSTTESDQRRALMMPQELMQMPKRHLIVLRAGMPPVRGRKIAFWREKAFAARVAPPPTVTPYPGFPRNGIAPHVPRGPPAKRPKTRPSSDMSDLTMVIPSLKAAGLKPLPTEGASSEQVEVWAEHLADAAAARTAREVERAIDQ
jgi:type IV secretion system protein VirD4